MRESRTTDEIEVEIIIDGLETQAQEHDASVRRNDIKFFAFEAGGLALAVNAYLTWKSGQTWKGEAYESSVASLAVAGVGLRYLFNANNLRSVARRKRLLVQRLREENEVEQTAFEWSDADSW